MYYGDLFVSCRWLTGIQSTAYQTDLVHWNKSPISRKVGLITSLVSHYHCSLQFCEWESAWWKCKYPSSCDSCKEVWIHSPQALPIIWLILAEKAGITAVICYFTWNKGRFKSHNEKLPTVPHALLASKKIPLLT